MPSSIRFMTSRYAAALFAAAALAGAPVSAGQLGAKPAALSTSYQSEHEWAVRETVTDIAEMAALAARQPRPAPVGAPPGITPWTPAQLVAFAGERFGPAPAKARAEAPFPSQFALLTDLHATGAGGDRGGTPAGARLDAIAGPAGGADESRPTRTLGWSSRPIRWSAGSRSAQSLWCSSYSRCTRALCVACFWSRFLAALNARACVVSDFTAGIDNSFSSSVPWHAGQAGASPFGRTSISNSFPHFLQAYSKIGMVVLRRRH